MFIRSLIPLVVLVALTGCVTTEPVVSLAGNYYEESSQEETTVVLIGEIPAAQLLFPGADCLLCIAAAKTMHTSLNDHVKSLDLNDFQGIGPKVLSGLSQQGIKASRYSDPSILKDLEKYPGYSSKENFAKLDYRPLQEQLKGDYLLLIEILGGGIKRNFASYIPTAEPVGFFNARVALVNLTSNEYALNRVFNQEVSSDGEWKDSPSYPALTTSLYQAITDAENAILEALEL